MQDITLNLLEMSTAIAGANLNAMKPIKKTLRVSSFRCPCSRSLKTEIIFARPGNPEQHEIRFKGPVSGTRVHGLNRVLPPLAADGAVPS